VLCTLPWPRSGSSEQQTFSAAWNCREFGSTPESDKPLLVGSGKFERPCARMQRAYFRSCTCAGTRTPLGLPLRGPVGYVRDIAFSPDRKLIATACSRHTVIWDTATRKTVKVFPGGAHGASAVSCSPDSLTVAIARSDTIVALYDLRTGHQTGKLVGYWIISDLDFSPDGKLLATATLGGGGSVFVWDAARQSIASTLTGALASYAVRLSPRDGKLVAVGDSSGKVVRWKLDPPHRRRVGGAPRRARAHGS
jgi:WD40 repeat protein